MDAKLPEFEDVRVRLRAMRQDDVPALFSLKSDPVGMRFWSHPPMTDLAQAQEMYEKTVLGAQAGEFLPWVVALSANDSMIGTCTLFAIDKAHRRAMIGYALVRTQWGNGYAQDALRMVLTYAFGTLQLHRIEADIDPRNTASARLIERMGFVREGLLRERWHVGSDVQDSALYGLLARDYAATQTG